MSTLFDTKLKLIFFFFNFPSLQILRDIRQGLQQMSRDSRGKHIFIIYNINIIMIITVAIMMMISKNVVGGQVRGVKGRFITICIHELKCH